MANTESIVDEIWGINSWSSCESKKVGADLLDQNDKVGHETLVEHLCTQLVTSINRQVPKTLHQLSFPHIKLLLRLLSSLRERSAGPEAKRLTSKPH